MVNGIQQCVTKPISRGKIRKTLSDFSVFDEFTETDQRKYLDRKNGWERKARLPDCLLLREGWKWIPLTPHERATNPTPI